MMVSHDLPISCKSSPRDILPTSSNQVDDYVSFFPHRIASLPFANVLYSYGSYGPFTWFTRIKHGEFPVRKLQEFTRGAFSCFSVFL